MAEQKLAIVTGGAGFVGSHLCKRLLDEGYKVISLDNYFSGSKDNHIKGVDYREGHTKDIEKHITETPDIIFHLGEYSRVAASLEEPEVVWDLNLTGTLGVLEFWRKHKCKLVYAGSSTKHNGVQVTGNLGRHIAPYTHAKATNTETVSCYSKWYDLPYVIVYFYNVYGPGERALEDYGTVVETFRKRHEEGKSMQVRRPGTQTRSFTHVEDTVEGIILAGEKGEGDEYGIGAKEVYSLLEVADMFGGEVEMLPPTKTTRTSNEIDVQKISLLGWKQQHTLKDYIESIK